MSPQSPADASEIFEQQESEQNTDSIPCASSEPLDRSATNGEAVSATRVILLTPDDVQMIATRSVYRILKGITAASDAGVSLPVGELGPVLENVIKESFDTQSRIRSRHIKDRLVAAAGEKVRG